MQNMLKSPWSKIVPIIPVDQHSVAVRAQAWQAILTKHGLAGMHSAIFGGKPQVRLSRQRLLTHAYSDPRQKCLEVFMWGWPGGSRGNLRNTFVANLAAIAKAAQQKATWSQYYAKLHSIGGIGISVISKLAYFHRHSFGSLPALILDSRIISVLSQSGWLSMTVPGLSYAAAANLYLDYLTMMSGFARKLKCSGDQIEFLLFGWGDAF